MCSGSGASIDFGYKYIQKKRLKQQIDKLTQTRIFENAVQ